MIRWKDILRILGFVTFGLAVSLLAPLAVSLYGWDEGLIPLLKAILVTTLLTALLFGIFCRNTNHELQHKEAVLVVVLAWAVVGLLGALPFYFSNCFAGFTDSVFECVSGFTTTGSSILSNVECLPASLHFWRALTHWIGGLGILVLMIAVLPLIGTGGMELYRAEFSGATSEKLKPRVAETALALWKIYVVYTLAGYIALRLVGMNPLDASCHTFAAIGTGGFSTRNASIESFNNSSAEVVLIALMIIGGVNFTQHYRLLVMRRPRDFSRDTELRYYLSLLGMSIVVVAASLYLAAHSPFLPALRRAAFQVVSIMTATGFSSTDFGLWPSFSQMLLLCLMFAGGCTGSTAGGLKIARVVFLIKTVERRFSSMQDPRRILAIRFNDRPAREEIIEAVLAAVYIAFLINVGVSLLLTAAGLDIISAISASAATMFNVGPGLGAVGPAANFGFLPTFAKWVLILNMLAGRLEFYAVLVIFTRFFWRK